MQDIVSNVLLGQEGLFESSKDSLKGKQRVELLKAIEGECPLSLLELICDLLQRFCHLHNRSKPEVPILSRV